MGLRNQRAAMKRGTFARSETFGWPLRSVGVRTTMPVRRLTDLIAQDPILPAIL